jgi:hypothetical protein|tara:strand:- start:25 stop:366 length:342 start_codon:yes stop_codon:yes gene_type:complete
MKYLVSLLLIIPLFAQNVTISQSEMLNIANNIKELQHSDSLKTIQIEMYDRLVDELEDQIKTDSLLLLKKSEQIEILKDRDEANEKMIKLVKPKLWEHRYIWFAIGIYLGKLL